MNDELSGRRGWTVVGASALALIVGQGSINVFAAGVFLRPISEEFGLGRGVIGSAIGLSNLMVAIATPFLGRLLDIYGVRRPLLISIVLFAIATAAMSLMQPSAGMVFLSYAVAGIFSAGQNPTAYSKIVMRWFDRQRGLALGVTLAGVGLGTTILPIASNLLIRTLGWRLGYVGLGIAILLIAFVPVLLFVHEPSSPRGDMPSARGPGGVGLTAGEAMRSWRYWVMVASFGVAAFAINGTLIHVVPLLTDRGISPGVAVAALSAAGLALIAGRLVTGWLMDRVFAPAVGAFFLVVPALGLALLGSAAGYPWPLVGTVMLGLGIGAEIDLMSFMIGRYFGTRAFGTLHGLMFMFAVLGNAAGASTLGWSFQLLGSYQPALVALGLLLVAASVALLVLGPYRYPAPDGTRPSQQTEAALSGLG